MNPRLGAALLAATSVLAACGGAPETDTTDVTSPTVTSVPSLPPAVATRIAHRTFLADFCPPGIVTTGGGDIPKRMYSTMTSEDRVEALDAHVGQ